MIKEIHISQMKGKLIKEALRYSLWIRCFFQFTRIGFCDDIHTKQRRAIKDPSAKFYVVMQRPPDYVRLDQIQACPVLAPSSEILQKLKTCQIEWIEYKRKYLKELQNPVAQELIKFIAHEAKEKDVYFVCGCEAEDRCHRFVLMDKFSDM